MIRRISYVLALFLVLAAAVSCGRSVSPAALKHAAEGQRLFELMQYEDAVKEYNEAIKIQPSFAAAYLGIGRCLAETGRFDEALKQYKTAMDLDPKNDDHHV